MEPNVEYTTHVLWTHTHAGQPEPHIELNEMNANEKKIDSSAQTNKFNWQAKIEL